eukprot:5299166-Pyramimonas_sp.AAC.1
MSDSSAEARVRPLPTCVDRGGVADPAKLASPAEPLDLAGDAHEVSASAQALSNLMLGRLGPELLVDEAGDVIEKLREVAGHLHGVAVGR